METKVYSIEGNELRSVVLPEHVFGLSDNKAVIYDAIKNELANRRVGTACTKGRAEVHGSNAKPYSQKGTGRARRGDKKSPVLVGGGTVFGPKPRDYSYSIPKKAKRLAMRTILSMKARNDRILVLEDFTIEDGKTKRLATILKKLSLTEKTVIIHGEDDVMLRRAGRNIPNLSLLSYNRLNAHELFYGRKIVLLEKAIECLDNFYSNEKEA